MKNNLIAMVIFAVFPFSIPTEVFAQAAPDELLEEAQPGVSAETDDLLSEMDAGTASEKVPESGAESTSEAESAVDAVATKATAVVPASNAAFEKIESLQVSDADLVAFMKSGGLRSRMMK